MLLYLFCNKSHYENVPFEIPENWVWCKLDNLAFYKKGPFGSSLTKSMFIPDNGDAYKVYEQKNAIQKDSNLGHYFISDEKFQELKGFEVLPNDIIVSCAGTIGETYIMPSDIRSGIINQALMIIRLHNIDITPFYLLYFDFILKNEAGKDGKGTAIKNIPPFDILKNYWIPLPPLAEQDRIIKEVALWQRFIDSIDGDIEDIFKLSKKTKSKILDLAIAGKLVSQDPNDEPAIELLKRINPAFKPCDNSHYENLPFEIPSTWVWVSHNDMLEISGGAQPPKSEFSEVMKPGYIRLYQIRDYGEKPIPIYIPLSTASKTTVKGDILLARYGGSLGKVFIAEDGAYNVAMAKVILCYPEVLNQKFVYYYYLSSIYQNKLRSISRTAQAGFNSGDFEDMYFPLPPLEEQGRIVDAISSIWEMIDMITAEL